MQQIFRAAALAVAGLSVLGVVGCTAAGAPQPAGTATAPTAAAPTAAAPAGATPSGATSEPAPVPVPTATSKDQPVAKAGRPDAPATPSVSAKPAKVGKPVSYSDGLKLTITDITFGKETGKGPGAFPGREFAVLALKLKNGSTEPLDLAGVVVTVLDAKGEPVSPVYADDASVSDFDDTVAPGRSAKAKYAFAVGKKSSSGVTVVVDFDGKHTSAVFRGSL